MANTVTIKISPKAKHMMDLFALKLGVVDGKAKTNDDVILELVRRADLSTYETVVEMYKDKDEKKPKK